MWNWLWLILRTSTQMNKLCFAGLKLIKVPKPWVFKYSESASSLFGILKTPSWFFMVSLNWRNPQLTSAYFLCRRVMEGRTIRIRYLTYVMWDMIYVKLLFFFPLGFCQKMKLQNSARRLLPTLGTPFFRVDNPKEESQVSKAKFSLNSRIWRPS